ncbi:MAG: hypothetical protein H6765_10440 [Candidatus Peribacteria bacterium]|nr:MAG: hypothetical protein H6765_10440 [Candidatus Peribacteria bacterium]
MAAVLLGVRYAGVNRISPQPLETPQELFTYLISIIQDLGGDVEATIEDD